MAFHQKNLKLVDMDTGQVFEGSQVLIPPKHKLKGDFFMGVQEGFRRLAVEKDLTGKDLKVLLNYMGNLDFENFIQIKQQDTANRLGIKRQQVYRSTKKLIEKGILIEGPKVGNSKTYRLNAFYGWKGKANKKYQEACEEHFRQVP